MSNRIEVGNAVLYHGDCLDVLKTLPDGSVQTCVTSPPYYGLRDYGVDGQIGLEQTPDEYIAKLVSVFREVRRVLRDDGTLWLNLGDSYAASQSNNGGYSSTSTLQGFSNPNTKGRQAKEATRPRKLNPGLKPKNLIGIPWRVAFALQADGWYLRQDIIWHKPNTLPESVRDRCTKAHEYIFLLSKSPRYYFDHEAMKEPAVGAAGGTPKKIHDPAAQGKHGATSSLNRPWTPSETRNRRSVWTVTIKPFKGAHFAAFPPDLVEPCILAGSRLGDTVLDPFGGVMTTAMVAERHNRKAIMIELNADYVELGRQRLSNDVHIDNHTVSKKQLQRKDSPGQADIFAA